VPRLIIADDSDVVRQAVKKFLAGDSRFAVVGEARDYTETIALAAGLKPDVLLVDARMPGAETVTEGLSKLIEACNCPVIVMSFSADADIRLASQTAGAARLLDKTQLFHTLIPAITEVLAERTA
jgi:DNA-binding NarL/FixJ family response regulator